jgi:hypothetical protein
MDGGSWMLKAAAAGDMHGGAGDTMIRYICINYTVITGRRRPGRRCHACSYP